MATQDTLPGTGQHMFNPMDHGLWKRFVDSDGRINHAAWLRARAEGQWVGTCRRCGDYLIPEAPHEHDNRSDYQASCRNDGCGYVMTAPGGRIALGSTRKSERK